MTAVASDLRQLNVRDRRTGLPPLIPELYDRLKTSHPGLTEPMFHALLHDLQRRDLLTLQSWDGGGQDQMSRQTGHAPERFPDHPRRGKAAWVQFREAKDAGGHEHKGAGPGGGQFTGGSGGGGSGSGGGKTAAPAEKADPGSRPSPPVGGFVEP